MSETLALDLVRTAIQATLVAAAPLLIAAMLVGFAVGLLQAVTQIQEQSLTFIPKLVVMALLAAAILPWLLSYLAGYLAGVLRGLPALAA